MNSLSSSKPSEYYQGTAHGHGMFPLVRKVIHGSRLGFIDEALSEQLQLEKENMEKIGKPDGFVFEELGELYLVKNDCEKAQEYFAKAFPLVNEALGPGVEQDRLSRIKDLAFPSACLSE